MKWYVYLIIFAIVLAAAALTVAIVSFVETKKTPVSPTVVPGFQSTTTSVSISKNLDMKDNRIFNLQEPVNEQEPTTKKYVDEKIITLATTSTLMNTEIETSKQNITLNKFSVLENKNNLVDLEEELKSHDEAILDVGETQEDLCKAMNSLLDININ
jgi:hypothetical protein